jgi:hypothetical protein
MELDYIKAPDVGPNRTLYVDPNFHYDAFKHTFPTIQGAIDWAIDNISNINDYFYQVLIMVYPGKYVEQIHSIDGIHIVGVHSQDNRYTKGPRLYMPGTSPETYPLRAEAGDKYRMYGMQIESAFATGVITELPELGTFSSCYFRGRFIESNKDVSHFLIFDDCEIRDVNYKAFDLTGTNLLGRRLIEMNHSIITRCSPVFSSTHVDEAEFGWNENSKMLSSSPHISGDWNLAAENSTLAGGRIGIEGRMSIGGTGDINIVNCMMTSGLHFTEDPGTVKILNSLFTGVDGIPVGEADITADVDIYDVYYLNNIQQNGICGKIHTTSKVANVGGDASNRYFSIQDAIDSLSGDGVVSIMPGTYTEQIHSTAGVRIQGRTHEGVPAIKSTILYNTGADSLHYPLGGDDTDVFTISDITIKTEPGAVIGKLSANNFTGVVFQNGHFIEATANQAMLMGLYECSFHDSMAFNLTGVGSGGMRAMTIIGCYFNDHPTHWVMDSTHTSTLVIIKNTIFHKFYPDIGGNWKVEISNSHVFGTSRSVINTTNRIALIQCIVSNGLHFTSNPDVIMHLNTFNDDCGYTITDEDITAAVTVTDVDYVGNVQQNGISGKIQCSGNVVYVGGDSVNRYYSIQDAIDSLPTGGVISLMPGTYTEQIHSTANVRIQGRTHEGVPAIKSTILYNTGADSLHYPLGGDDTDVFTISDITIKTEPNGIIGKLSASNFTGVVFQNGYFIEATANQAMLMGFSECSFEDSMAFNLFGTGSGGMRAMTIIGCYFNDYATHWVMDSTHDTTLVIVKNTIFHKFYPDIGGNWKVEFSNSHVFGTSRSVISTTNRIAYIQCILSNGLHFTSNPDVIMHLNTFNDDCGYAITGADITASLTVTGVDYTSNVQQNGLAGEIQYLCPNKPVGCNVANRYITVQDAIDSVATGDDAIIVIHQDFTGLAKLTLPASTKISIDCQRKYSMTFTGDIVDVGVNQELSFIRYVNLTGGKIDVNGNNAVLAFEASQYISAYITLTAGTGSFCVVYNSSLTAASGHPAVTVNNLDTLFVLGYSRLKGIETYPAILYNVQSINKTKTKFSTLIHGDGITSPMIYGGAGKVNVSMYNCGLNASFSTANFTNLVGSPNLTVDANINF